jgi:heat shock protein HslJ
MKFGLCFLSLIFSALAPACSPGSAPIPETLENRVFALYSADGREFQGRNRPTLAFDAGLRVSGSVCNRFTGPGELKDGILTLKNPVSTRMLCLDDELGRLEELIAGLLTGGAELRRDGDKLLLLRDGHILVYRPQGVLP